MRLIREARGMGLICGALALLNALGLVLLMLEAAEERRARSYRPEKPNCLPNVPPPKV